MDLTPLWNVLCSFFSFIQHQENNVPETRPLPSGKSVLREEFDDMIKNFHALEAKLKSSEEQIFELKKNAVNERVDALEAKLKSSKEQIDILKSKDKDQVVFSAAVGTGNYSYGPHTIDTILKFRAVITNIGEAYDKDTGYFVAPFSGIYYFVFFVHAGGECKSNLYLVKEGKRILQVHNHKLSSEKAANGGNAVFLELKKNDKVSIVLDKGSHVWISDTHTTFSCFLVKKIEDEKADSPSS